jgi:sec-independent protein translocase protein TatA
LVLAAILILFGGKGLPDIARKIGKTMEDLRKTSQDFKDQLLRADEAAPDKHTLPPASIPAGHDDVPPHPTPPKEVPPRDPAG